MTTHVQSAEELDMFMLHLFVKCPLFMPLQNCIFTQEDREKLTKKEKLEMIHAMSEEQKREMLSRCDRCYRIGVVS